MSELEIDFEAFWMAYPRRVGKGAARKAFVKARQKATLTEMLNALEWQRHQEQWSVNGGSYIPHPRTWLNQERWADERVELPALKEASVRTLKAIYQS